MPLKHHTETAYLIVLGLIICLAGVYLSLLPVLPQGLWYWATGFVVSIAYPLILRRTFRSNRADYEFRLLHWFPAGMFFLWMVMHITAPYMNILEVLRLGFFYLWSMPLVALGLFFIAVFASHVIRRKAARIGAMVLVGALFASLAFSAESLNINPELARAFFPYDQSKSSLSVPEVFAIAKKRVGYIVQRQKNTLKRGGGMGADMLAWWDGKNSDSGKTSSASVASSATSSVKTAVASVVTVRPPLFTSSSSSTPAIKKPTHLTQSGPEGVVLLALTLVALYAGTLHSRSRNRV
ncbi:MAG: hypothetical protein ABL890_02420 [Candidatus Peribacteraceae bacterium]